MNGIKFPGVVTAIAAALIAAPTTAHADEPVPAVDEVLAVLTGLTDPNIPAVNKTNIVTPGFSPEEAGTTDDHLNRMRAKGLVPLNFVVTDIQPAPNNSAGATVATVGSPRQHDPPIPIVLVNQGGQWMLTHDTPVHELDVIWSVAHRHISAPGFAK